MSGRSEIATVLNSSAPGLSDEMACEIAQRVFGIDGVVVRLTSERDRNFRLRAADGRDYVLKAANSAEPVAVTRFQTDALVHIAKVAPDLPVPRIVATRDGASEVTIDLAEGGTSVVRLMTFLHGEPLHKVPRSASQRRSIARCLARLDQALARAPHPPSDHVLQWDIKNALELRTHVGAIADRERRHRVERILADFEDFVAPRLPGLRSQVIHNDFNPHNILIAPDDPAQVSGILDFGDMVLTPMVVDLAVACAYQASAGDHPLATIAEFVSAYHAANPLTPGELDVLFDLIKARLVTTVVVTGWRATRYPENRDYILRNNPPAWAALDQIEGIGREEARDYLATACAMKGSAMRRDTTMVNAFVPGNAALSEHEASLVERRERLLGPAYRLFYARPVEITRGEGVWLYEASGNALLDVYNNVASVGHCHPHVVQALSRQAAILSTNTRYLSETILDYAEKLLGYFPPELQHVMFTCTGSESNDLAMRLARARTGGTGFIVTECAYHGTTLAVAGMSPSLGANVNLGEHVRVVPAPNRYRYGTADVAETFRASVQAAIDDLQRHGIKPAALIADSIFSSDGVLPDPAGFMQGAVAAIRAAGGLFIADEVQPGFGRTGSHMWGFQRHGVVPDMVSLGKPMGNGYPVAGLVMRPDVVQDFGRKARYFNTFGGNTVASAVALAVLEVIENEGLMENALKVGAYFRGRLDELAGRYPLMGDVRSAGLFLGVDIVKDRATRSPDPDLALAIVNGLRENNVLISATGPQANILKIRPPLTFSTANADFFVEKLERVLESVQGGK